MTDLLLLALGASLVNAHLLTGVPRACPLVGLAGRFDTTVALSLATALLTSLSLPLALAAVATVPRLPGSPALPIVLLEVALALALDGWLRLRRPLLRARLGLFLPVAALNGALFGLAVLPLVQGRTPLDALGVVTAAAAIYAVAPVCVAGLQVRLAAADVPVGFRGLPLAFLTAGLVALALAGVGGWAAR
ncbi:MAG: Rnf-Nqr domain containing protein [Steroidobacteraceae bacterium]